uniref:IZUMO family member 4 n=1 Tax=Cavia porcellus TaxID=10141 RepID=H0VJT4_CAVPO
MALTLAALLLWGLSGPGGWGCLQCDHLVLAALAELRAVLVPSHFHSPQLQARAQDLLLGMQGPFFRDYALGAFVGMAEVEQLEDVASFLHNQTQLLRDSDLTEGPLLEELVNFREEVIKEFKEVLRAYELKGTAQISKGHRPPLPFPTDAFLPFPLPDSSLAPSAFTYRKNRKLLLH